MIRRIALHLDDGWTYCREDDPSTIRPAVVPGCVQLDLIRDGLVPNPFDDSNVDRMLDVEKDAYLYECQFSWDRSQTGVYDLVFEGIDTVADIELNGSPLGHVENMFIPHRFTVSDRLRDGTNCIRVRFPSQSGCAEDLCTRHNKDYLTVYESKRVYLRKAQYAFGWDWCPRIVTSGIWKAVYIERVDPVRLHSPGVASFREEGTTGQAVFRIEAVACEHIQGSLSLVLANGEGDRYETQVQVDLPPGDSEINVPIAIERVRKWYPRGYGDPARYRATVQYNPATGPESPDSLGLSFDIGFRTVEIRREEDAAGESFVLVINGQPIYAKGANLVPTDMFPSRVTPQSIRNLVTLAEAANMNMLRVWGGGYYEQEAFYDECDRRGILVWQDFMFACGQYPDEHDWFRILVEREAVEVVRMLRKHPSVVLWCGSNENLWALHSWWPGEKDAKFNEFLGRYIYHTILPQAVEQHAGPTPYWESSPFGGEDPNDPSRGDSHIWGVWAEWKDIRHYQNLVPRFASEFGMQSMPTLPTLKQHISPARRTIPGADAFGRNRQEEGVEKTMRYIFGCIGIPASYDDFVLLSQWVQGEAMKVAIEHWRGHRPINSGVLFWQYNDCWPGPSQSCVDFHGRKKALHYYTRRLYEDLHPILAFENDSIILKLINDLTFDLDFRAWISGWSLDGKLRFETHLEGVAAAESVSAFHLVRTSDLDIPHQPVRHPVSHFGHVILEMQNQALRDMVFHVRTESVRGVSRNHLVMDRLRDLHLVQPHISLLEQPDGVFAVSDVPAFGVHFETDDDREPMEDFVAMEPGVPFKVYESGPVAGIRVRDITRMIQVLT